MKKTFRNVTEILNVSQSLILKQLNLISIPDTATVKLSIVPWDFLINVSIPWYLLKS
jgi:hypothetical protein